MKLYLLIGILTGSLLAASGCQTGPSAGEMEQAASQGSPWIGRQAPGFELVDQRDQTQSLAEKHGSWVVLYFYPKDDTPGCTCQATEFTELLFRFEKLNAVVWGVSEDSPASHRRFAHKHDLQITLLSNPDHDVMRSYDAWLDYAALHGGRAIRSTFLIDPDGIVRRHWPEVIPNGHAARVSDALAELQQSSLSRSND